MKTIKFLMAFCLILMSFSVKAQYDRRYIYYTSQQSIIAKDYYKAISLLTLLIDSDSVSTDAYFLRAIAKYNLNDLLGAEQDFTSVMKTNPVYIEAFQYRAITRSIMGNWDDAISDFRRAISIRPDYTDIYYSRGVTYLMCQQFDNAVQDFDKFLKKKPNEVDAYINRGAAYMMLKDTTSAYNDYLKAVEVAPRSSQALARLGIVKASIDNVEGALEDFNKAIYYDANNETAYFNRAILHANNNAPMRAIADFSSVIELDSLNSLSYFNRAITKSQIGDFNSAMDDYDMVVELAPNNVLGYYNRAALAYRLGDLEKSVNDYSATLELYPDFANAYLARSAVRYDMGDMLGSKRDKEIADAKINEYQKLYGGSEGAEQFSMFADTSRNFNKILAFDSGFNAGDRVKERNVDIKLLPMYRLVKTGEVTEAMREENKRSSDVLEFLDSSNIDNLIISNKEVDMTREEVIAERQARATNRDKVSDMWRSMLEDAISSYSIRQYSSSITELTRAIEADSDNPYLYMTRSTVNFEMMEFIQSIGTGSQRFVIEKDKSKELHTTERNFNYEAALEDINRAILLNPNIAYFYYNRANIHVLNGDMANAIANYARAIELDNRFAEAYYNRGLVQIYLKESKKGFLDLSRAGELGINSAYDVIEKYMDELSD